MSIEAEDLRAAVAAGILTEAQAAGVTTIAHDRAGKRAHMPAEDEPFEFFKGFSEIFVSVGLILLLVGALTVAALGGMGEFIPAVGAIVAWLLALYFTKQRRMSLPSIVLASAFGICLGLTVAIFLDIGGSDRLMGAMVGLIGMGAMAIYYRIFRVPFAMFVLGTFGLIVISSLVGSSQTMGIYGFDRQFIERFDLRQSSGLALGTLVFGALTFLGAMWFDTRDPHRLGRSSATGFWLHLLAAPALVNTVAITFLNVGGTPGYLLTAAALFVITCFALVIDRRSFLTAGIVYLGIVLAWALGADEPMSVALLLIVLGALVTFIGAFWVQLRGGLMRALPNFPGKSRLPPYTEAT